MGGGGERERVQYVLVCISTFTGVGRVFTWGYGNDGQLANNESKGRYSV